MQRIPQDFEAAGRLVCYSSIFSIPALHESVRRHLMEAHLREDFPELGPYLHMLLCDHKEF